MKAKERYRQKIIEYLADPDNEPIKRCHLGSIVGITRQTLYRHFTPDELTELESEALDVRRKAYPRFLPQIDKALWDKGLEGSVEACKLIYKKFEGWREGKDYILHPGDASVNVDVLFIRPDKDSSE